MNPALVLTALAATCLASLILFELRPLPPATVAQTTGPAALTTVFALATRTTSLETLLARPLFSQTRRPGPQSGPAAARDAPAIPLPRMTGILIDGTRRSAIFAAATGGKPITVAEGGHLGAFTVQAIDAQQVVVLGPEGRRVVHTSFDPTLPPPVVTSLVAPQFPGLIPGIIPGLIPDATPISAPLVTPGGRLPGISGFPQSIPPGQPGTGSGAAR